MPKSSWPFCDMRVWVWRDRYRCDLTHSDGRIALGNPARPQVLAPCAQYPRPFFAEALRRFWALQDLQTCDPRVILRIDSGSLVERGVFHNTPKPYGA